MTETPEEKIKRLSERQHVEATIHWNRNGFFLLSSSIMLLALSQFESLLLMISFGVMGIMLNLVWFCVQFRSSEYIKKWKSKVTELEKKM